MYVAIILRCTVVVHVLTLFQLFDNKSFTYTYLLADKKSREAVLIDPVIELVSRDLNIIRDLDLKLKYAGKCHQAFLKVLIIKNTMKGQK